ncbi:hypothetical protein [Candidatus Binatus sp.]|uniref:hypothetical protein n=1 Tax=Candidatus Binatus sp. TaxID=2811406 RepID=UPI003CAFBEB9
MPRMVDLNTHLKKARRAARAAWAKKTEEEKNQAVSKASHAFWDSKTAQQRSNIMKKRARTRKKNRTAKRGK